MNPLLQEDLPTVASQEVQVQAQEVLKAWECRHTIACDCFPFRTLLARCAAGLPLYQAQHETIALILKRGAK